ncbi:MAG: hypothetical protein QG585_10 [Patescibacteria group bacterium]|nr:hypothetical protein [Patescibacteria group bacterium]
MTINNKQLIRKKLLQTVFLLFLCFLPLKSLAAVISIESEKNNFKIGELFVVEVFLDTEKDTVNALEGSLVFQDKVLEVKEIREGNSVMNFWVEKPTLISENKIGFSGITPLGITGKEKYLFSVLLEAKKDGKSDIVLGDVQVLRNDGDGGSAVVKKNNFNFDISKDLFVESQEVLVDNVPPEIFTPYISSDGEIYEGQNFLVFSAQDKGKGIKYYEVREGFLSFFKKAESPYLLKDQSLKKRIYVKALDLDGNKRVVVINNSFNYFNLLYVIIIAMIFRIILKFWLRKKYEKK